MIPARDDDALLAELAAALAPDLDPPAGALEAARASFTWRTVDAELATLAHDSLLDAVAGGVRAGTGPRLLTFDADGLVVELEVDDAPGSRRLIGQLTPPGPARLELLGPDGTAGEAHADELGRFVMDLPPAPVRARLRVTPAAGPAVECSWTTF